MKRMWGLEWRSKNTLDGERRYIMWNMTRPLLFDTRREARTWRDLKYGYIRERPDLRSEPHGWRMPRVVKVLVSVEPSR